MLYLGLEIDHYKQLVACNPGMVRTLEAKMDGVVKQNNAGLFKRRAGLFLYAMGEENDTDPKDVLDAALQLAETVAEFREELYGYNLLLATLADRRPANVEARFTGAFLDILDGEGLWIHARDTDLFKRHAHFESAGSYARIVESRKNEPSYNVISYVPRVRKRAIKRLAQLLLGWLTKTKGNPSLALVTGPIDCALEEIVSAALRSVLGKERALLVHVVARGNSAVSAVAPLVESLKAVREGFLKRVPHYLEPHERRIWKSYESFLLPLLDGKPASGDRSEEDFFIVYHLYLTAYFRLMRERHLPGIIVFRKPERLPPFAVERLKTVCDDLGRRFRIAVVLVSSRGEAPAVFRDYARVRIAVKPFGLQDTRRCFTALYPGVAVPRKVVETVHRLSRGRYGALLHLIYYLRLNRKIAPDGSRFTWVPRKEVAVKIPVRQRTATVVIMRSLKEEARTVLFVGYSLGGFFFHEELLDFFAVIGLTPKKVEEQIAYLRSMELFFGNERPRFSALLRGAIRRLSVQKAKYLEDRMRAYVRERLPQFLPARAARCFRFLASLEAAADVVDHLVPVINHYLDARLLPQAEFFLTPERYLRPAALSEERRMRLRYILFACRLRFHLLKGDVAGADKLAAGNALSTESLVPQPYFARLYLELGRFQLCRGETAKALPLLKKAVQYFQELSMTAPTGESFLELGCGFLAKGNLKEALEYFSFATKLVQDSQAPFIHARSLWFESVALYLRGNYSRILSNCDEAALLAGSHGFRETELLFGVLKARVFFDLGHYERASLLLRESLALARLYGFRRAETMLFAWIARCASYQGQTGYAYRLLRALEETDETLFIRGELHFLAGELKKAEKVFTKALHRRPADVPLFPEYNSWEGAFPLVEGRCLDLNAHGTPVIRLCRAYRAVLQCRAGNLDEGIAELHLLTTTEKFSEADPHVYLFYYLYYTVLKTLEKKKTSLQEVGHGLTILNQSLKHLQERSTVIDEPRDRIQYVSRNYWNKLILEEAKLNKLM